jgi:type II pantothenate kinase
MSPVVVDSDKANDGGVALSDGGEASPTTIRTRPRTMTSLEEIDNTIIRPGAVRINVEGAFIVDANANSPDRPGNGTGNGRGSPTHHETSDIRLPNHTAVVSHIAVDVCAPPPAA